ncbi:sensor histidine kinase [Lacticaseibacillus songhuajiangensis]|uniref:sensor histidine kinase n=1 Tax=Lacticaseibacillus songhuajiangensis TaxID=1296539 RepID=UPI000F7B5B0A|nr:HAMP domain-containing sensor histidine kinase [Lacticaseibacillus songhuajiangensis]
MARTEKSAKAAKPRSSASRMARTYIGILVPLMLIVSMATVSVVGYHLERNKREDATQLLGVLQKSFSDYKPDWDYWRDTASINTHNTFVRVVVRSKGKTRYYYSHRTKRFLNDQLSTWSLMRNIQYQPDQGIYYHATKSEVYEKNTHVRYEVWLSLNNMVELFKLILEVIVSISLLGILIGIWLITILARRLNQPLVDLTVASHRIAQKDSDTVRQALPVPTEPLEVHDLTIEFNRLLDSLNSQLTREHQFVSDASHELRTPLAAIRGHIELIQRHSEQHPEIVPQSLATISEESLKMQHLIESLLQLSRMDHAKLEAAPFDVSALCHAVAARYQEQLPQELLLIGVTNVWALGNEESVEQILIALLNNASKYSPADSTITVNVQTEGDKVFMTVSDEGMGISDVDKAKIFNRFYRVDSSRSKKIAGTGLGLAIVARLAALNDAEITVSDNHPRGSRFKLELWRTDQP